MKILIIDEDIEAARSIARALCGLEVCIETDLAAGAARAVRAELEGHAFDGVLCRFPPNGLDRLDTLVRLRSHYERPGIILMSGYEDVVDAAFIADAVLLEPFCSDDVRSAIAQLEKLRSRPLLLQLEMTANP